MLHIDGLLQPQTKINQNMDEYIINIDNIEYNIPISNIYEFMTISDTKFKKLCTNSSETTLYGIPKEHFAYACINYLSERKKKDLRFSTPQICNRYSVLLHYELIDFEAVNKDLEIVDKVYNTIELDNELKNLIINGIPNDYSLLEKAIYIYIKMCQVFTYDREYFAQNQSYKKDISYISTLSLTNREIVCFEFSVIYGQLLAELGINFRSYYGKKQRIYELRTIMDDGELEYGQKHAFTEFRVGKFLVDVDAMESILEGDLVNAKTYKALNGIQCINSNRKTEKEFYEVLDKVYKSIKETESKDYHLPEKYKSHQSELSFKEKFTILLNQIEISDLKGLDAYGYLLELKRNIFTDEEQKNNFSMSIIRTNETSDINKQSDIIAIIAMNEDGFEYYPENTEYYLLYPDLEITKTDDNYIEKEFNNGTYEYINITKPTIPNININNKKDNTSYKKSFIKIGGIY